MRVLITGGSGRLGSEVASQLLALGHGVVNADKRPPAVTHPGGDYRFVQTDLSNVGEVAGALAKCEALVHLGAIPWPYEHADEVVFTNNTNATFAVLQAAALLGMKKAVLASTLAMYGIAFGPEPKPPRFTPVDETHPLIPSDPYALGKEVDERIGEMFHRQTGMSVIPLRFHWIATAEQARGAAKSTAENPERGRRVLWGYVDVRDAASACVLALEAEGIGFAPMIIASADTLSEIPTDELLARYAPETERRSPIAGTAGAFSTKTAERLIGYRARHSWRDEEEA
jgi:nucleoside-diphosphate-sugar epimerase